MGSTIEYSVEKRHLAISKGVVYVGKLHMLQPVTMDVLVDSMTHKNTTISRQDILGVLDLYHEVIMEKLAQGHVISTPLFRACLSLKGEFDSLSGTLDKKKHKAHVTIRPAKGLTKKVTKNLRFRKKRDLRSSFFIDSIVSLETGRSVKEIKKGKVIEVQGSRLKVYRKKAKYTVEYYLQSKLIAESKVVRITNSKAATVVPKKLPPDTYSVCFVKQFGSTLHRSKKLRLTVL
jgi:hypothetical protein